jgi:hypothetical protein
VFHSAPALRLARLHELEQRHLSGGVLQRYAIDAQAELRLATAPLLLGEVVRMGDEDLLGQCERSAKMLARRVELRGHGCGKP